MSAPFPEAPPRLYALPPGVDFGAQVVRGLRARLSPQALAQAEIFVNTRRMQRHLRRIFAQGPASLLPRIRMVTDPGQDPTLTDLPPAISPLRRQLELSALIADLLERAPELAPSTSLFSLSESLAALLAEMQGEGVAPEALRALDVSDESGHWARALRFVDIAATYLDQLDTGPSAEARTRAAVMAQIHHWETTPPQHPVIVAGSTGSRGTTALLIEAVARLPQGAVILPGVDGHMPAPIWAQLKDALSGEDHPQFRFAALARRLGCEPSALPLWTDTPPQSAPRNALVSLALRPAPVTDGWRREGPALRDLPGATAGLTLLEAPSPRLEAEAIALRLHRAATEGTTAALITNDRVLTRQVAAALDRWDIVPDDSAGQPLQLSPPGRFLRHVAAFFTQAPSAESLLTLLKHPLCHSGAERGPHLRATRELELSLRREGPPYPTSASMAAWGEKHPDLAVWAEWVAGVLAPVAPGPAPLTAHVMRHLTYAQTLAAGPTLGSGALWDSAAGRAAKAAMDDLHTQAPYGGPLGPRDYLALVTNLLSAGEVRQPQGTHPHILIWGTLEARVQSADLLILAGLNEGSWPEAPGADPWLNRRMRAQAGLLLPDRSIGLAAHDFQMAIAGREVWLSRAARSDEAETVPSRWLNRLVNLLDGLEAGQPCLAQMRARGAAWLAQAAAQDRPAAAIPPAPRPAPRPPVAARPKRLRITDVALLLRDPYGIYAREVLGLSAVDPLMMSADARAKGIAVHEIMEHYVRDLDPLAPDAEAQLCALTDRVLAAHCPWPTARLLWRAQMGRNASAVVAAEILRRGRAAQQHLEIKGQVQIGDVALRGRADRIDIDPEGRAWIYDYKTGKPPSAKSQGALDKQLLVEAAMVQHGGFAAIGPAPVAFAAFLQIGAAVAEVAAPLDDHPPDRVWADLHRLLANWADPAQGYTARMAAQSSGFGGVYDQLARYGEWDASQEPQPEDVG